jgi:hypothetical protein
MRRDTLILLILIPATMAGQNRQLSEAAAKLLRKPQLGNAQLTRSDGRKDEGRIVRVTDQFITFETNSKPSSCENVELSKVAAVHWLGTTNNRSASEFGGIVLLGALLAPQFAGYAIADPFRRISPPLQPLRGTWEAVNQSRGGSASTMKFKGSTIEGHFTTVRNGHYSVGRDQLHMMFNGEPETVIPFRFNCTQLILDSPAGTLGWSKAPSHVSGPIVGEWGNKSLTLNFKLDGSFEERKEEVRSGTFEQTAAGLKIHWNDGQGQGGQEWNAQIEHRHMVIRIGSVVAEYRYVPSGLELDL